MAKKKASSKTAAFSWPTFLKKASRDLLQDVSIREDLPAEMIESQWLGYPGATATEIAALEKRLKMPLPPSYRSFLETTNGWRNCGAFIHELWPCSKVQWFRKRNQDWIDAYCEDADDEDEPTDKEYFVYGKKQNASVIRTRYLKLALEISAAGDSAILLLNPDVVDDAGEWEAWFFANWLPGATRYRSFRELMAAEQQTFLRLHKKTPSTSKFGNPGQHAARRGETDRALELLRAESDPGSLASLAELCAFRGLWDEALDCLGKLFLNLGALVNFDDYHGNLLRLVGRAGRETKNWKAVAAIAKQAAAAEGSREYDAGHEHVRKTFVTWFRNLEQYAQRHGKPPNELVRIFGYQDPIDDLSEAERRQQFAAAIRNPHSVKLSKDPVAYAHHCFAIARNLRLDDELLQISESNAAELRFEDALEVARALVRRKQPAAAWKLVIDRLAQTACGTPEQVTPLVLLVDETLSPLMNRARCEEVLSIPRGPDLVR